MGAHKAVMATKASDIEQAMCRFSGDIQNTIVNFINEEIGNISGETAPDSVEGVSSEVFLRYLNLIKRQDGQDCKFDFKAAEQVWSGVNESSSTNGSKRYLPLFDRKSKRVRKDDGEAGSMSTEFPGLLETSEDCLGEPKVIGSSLEKVFRDDTGEYLRNILVETVEDNSNYSIESVEGTSLVLGPLDLCGPKDSERGLFDDGEMRSWFLPSAFVNSMINRIGKLAHYADHQDCNEKQGNQMISPAFDDPVVISEGGQMYRLPSNEEMMVLTWVLGEDSMTVETSVDWKIKDGECKDWLGG
jgi:hypothetical protein